jgi:cell fate (sporulation/competence/biofilm development) regulator YlbF (YheA/YmcA/DUF963 family)
MDIETIAEKARELGRLIGQTGEYQALDRARNRIGEDRDVTQTVNRLTELEEAMAGALREGREPAAELQSEYETTFATLQASPVYQGMVAAQANFEKILARVNQHVSEGIETAARSRIILPG